MKTAERLEEAATAGTIDSERKIIINMGARQRTERSSNFTNNIVTIISMKLRSITDYLYLIDCI